MRSCRCNPTKYIPYAILTQELQNRFILIIKEVAHGTFYLTISHCKNSIQSMCLGHIGVSQIIYSEPTRIEFT